MKLPAPHLCLLLLMLLCVDLPASGYQHPSASLAALVDAPLDPLLRLSPDGRTLALLERPPAPPVAELARDVLGLAGLRIDPLRYGPADQRVRSGLRLLDLESGEERQVIGLPPAARFSWFRWAPDGRRAAFALRGDKGWTLWWLDRQSASVRQASPLPLNAVLADPFQWLPDSRTVVALFRLQEEAALPTAPPAPRVLETGEEARPGRTWQNLLQSPADGERFSALSLSRLALLELDSEARWLGLPAAHWLEATPSPDGNRLYLEELLPPWSLELPWYRFAQRLSLYDLRDGASVLLARKPLADAVPIAHGSTTTGPRSVHWRPDQPATLVWTEALDEGDARVEAEMRDRVLAWHAPFTEEPRELYRSPWRVRHMDVAADGRALAWSYWYPTRRERCELLRPEGGVELLFDRDSQDRYTDPGSALTRPSASGHELLLQQDGHFLFRSRGASPEGERPFLSLFDPEDGSSEILFRSRPPWHETVIEVLDADRLLLRRENAQTPRVYGTFSLADSAFVELLRMEDPHPELTAASRRELHYLREDSLALHATLWTPPGWSPEQGPLPTVLWAYPGSYTNRQAAGQVQDSPWRFHRSSPYSARAWLLQGYAVIDDPSMPIVGEDGQKPNDTFVTQLVANARAAIDAAVAEGVCDPQRVAVGGHSYGAFMATNLLAHSDLFRAGIARSGAYNRSLTPFGFQVEDRSFWEAREVYWEMSPFTWADRIDEPLLLIHGAEDSNSGTYPMQSERLFQAIKGLGGQARLCLLPHEGHGYRARESRLQMLYETERWLEEHVKNAPPRAEPETGESTP